MSDLGREAQELLRAARSFDEPSAADASRVHASVLAKVGVAVGVGAGITAAAPSLAASPLGILGITAMKIGAAVVIAGGLATAGYVTLRETRPQPVAGAVSTHDERAGREPFAPVITPTQPSVDDRGAERLVPAPLERTKGPRAKAVVPAPSAADRSTRGASDLEAEARLLEQADADLRRGDPNAALARLAEHAVKYPSGALREERQGIRVIALCRAGREEGKTAAERFLAHAPSSSLASRIRAACGD